MLFRKSALSIALAGMLVVAPLAGCAGNQQNSSAVQSSAESAQSSTEQITGGWIVNEEFTAVLSSDEQKVFESAAATYTGAQLTPIAVLATQVVSGTNYAFLCSSKPTTQGSVLTYCIAVVYEDLEGNAQITSVKDLDPNNLAIASETADSNELVGGWTIAHHEGTIIPADASTALTSAMKNYDGMMFRPLVLLATQVVSGTNYLILCEGAAVTQDPQEGLYAVTVYADLSGNAQISNVQMLNLLAYVS